MGSNLTGQLWQKTRKARCLFPLLFFAVPLCGFSWGNGPDPCAEANKIYSDSKIGITEQLAEQIVDLCPEGAVGHLANGFLLEESGDAIQAIDEYRKAIKADPTLSMAHGNLGLLLLGQGTDNEAAAELIKALNGSNDFRYHRGLALILNRSGSAPMVLYFANESLKVNPHDTEVLSWMAGAYAQQVQLDKAAEAYSKVLATNPENEPARLGLAEVYDKAGKLEDAKREYAYAIKSNPTNKGIHKHLSEIYQKQGDKKNSDNELLLAGLNPTDEGIDALIRQGDQQLLARKYEKAVETYEAVLKKRPNWSLVHEKIGDAQVAAGRDDEAITSYRKSLAADPLNSSLHYTIGVLLERKGLLNEAEAEYRKSLQMDPQNSDARRHLADMYTLRGKFHQSIEEYTELIKLRGENPILHFKLARVYEKDKAYKKAIDEYLEAIRLAPDNLETRKELSSLYTRRKMNAEAEVQYREILRLDRNNEEIRTSLISNLVKRKKYDDLLQLFKETAEQNPNDSNIHYKLGLMYDFTKEYDLAAEEYQKAIDLNGKHARAMNAYGRMCIKTSKVEKARELLEAARIADPNFTEPRQLLDSLRDDRIMRPSKHPSGTRKGKKNKKNSAKKKPVKIKTKN